MKKPIQKSIPKPKTGSDKEEKNTDSYNIDYIRRFRFSNFMFALLGSLVGFANIYIDKDLLWPVRHFDINGFYAIFLGGALLWLIFTTLICYFAGNSAKESLRLASRRGLFPFSVMLVTSIVLCVLTGMINWETTFYNFLKLIMYMMIIMAFYVLPLDYGIAYKEGLRKEK